MKGSTASSPYAILLFHRGTYLGTATATQYGFLPMVVRTNPATIAVTYTYAQGADSNADPTGRAHASYSWNASTGKVDMTGNTPPSQ